MTTREQLIEAMARAMIITAFPTSFSNESAGHLVKAALTAIEAAGLCIVPVEATEAMEAAAYSAYESARFS